MATIRRGMVLGKVQKMSGRSAVLDHTEMGVSDMGRSAAFYDAALGALGLRRSMQIPEGEGTEGIGYGVEFPIFWINLYKPHSMRNHTAFAATSREQVDAFHAAGIAFGGTDNGAPGDRAEEWTPEGEELTFEYYAAFVIDPDGNNIEAVYRGNGTRQSKPRLSAEFG